MNSFPLAADEPLSPELVLVLAPELRAQVLASMPLPAWAEPRPRALELPAPVLPEPWPRAVAALVVARAAHLMLIFVAVTILTLILSLVAQAGH